MLAGMGMVRRASAVVGVAAVLALGCGGNATNGGAGAGAAAAAGAGTTSEEPTAASFAAQLAQLACDTLEPCCSAARLTFDRAACLKAFDIGPIESSAGIAFDPAAAQRCVEEFTSATRACSAFAKFQLSDCNLITYGTLPLGAACTSERQCAATPGRRTACDYAPNATTGTCALVDAVPHAARGESCLATCLPDGECTAGVLPSGPAGSPIPPEPSGACYVADGLYCDTADQQCLNIGGSGDLCTSLEGCSSGLACVGLVDQYATGTGVARPGKCAPPLAEGAPCAREDECATFACDAATKVCVHVPLATPELCVGMLPGAD